MDNYDFNPRYVLRERHKPVQKNFFSSQTLVFTIKICVLSRKSIAYFLVTPWGPKLE